MNLKLEDKTALVSGSTAGIGFAIARSLAAEGTRVIVNGRTEARVSESMASIRRSHPHARLEPFVANLANAEAAIASARRFPSIDILVNKPRCLRAEAIRTNQRQRTRLSRQTL